MLAPKQIYLIRHGETEWSKLGKHTGRTDLPLTGKGKEEALLLKQYPFPSFAHVFVSPLKRAQETCRLAGYREDGVIKEALYEWDYGQYEGLTSREIHQIDPNWTIFSHGAPGGESLDQITLRCKKFLEFIAPLEGPIALFSSGHILRALTAVYLGQPLLFGQHIVLSTGMVSILGDEHQTPAILKWNTST
ncbi:MAG: histidine phosphatase family protein [Simkaniaceae bacterium]|nr:histidine phosphatase family protein [Simkaniaceae bacterium]